MERRFLSMRGFLCSFLRVALASFALSESFVASSAALAAAEPLFRQRDVFVSGADGYFAYRIPAIEVAPDGTILAFAEARKYHLGDPGYDGQDIDLVLKRSSDSGETWSSMAIVEDPGERWSAANPATLVDRAKGLVWLFYLRGKPDRNTRNLSVATGSLISTTPSELASPRRNLGTGSSTISPR